MVITWNNIGSDEDLAREVLIVGRDIAPCIASFSSETEDGKNAIAVLRRVFKSLAQRGSTLVRSQSVGPASISYTEVESAFDGQPRRALRALCDGSSEPRGHSVGSFPSDRPLKHLWPEGGY